MKSRPPSGRPPGGRPATHASTATGVATTGALMLLLGTGGAYGDDDKVDVVNRTAEVMIPPGANLHLDIPVGELKIVGTDGDRLDAVMDIGCEADDGGCAERALQARFVQRIEGDDVYLDVEPKGKNQFRNAAVRVRIAVPPTETMHVTFGAGELQISDVQTCPSLRMMAGEARIYADAARIGEVKLGTMFGESSLYLDDSSVDEKRPFLVGGKIDWDEGEGECRLEARLRFGELAAHLKGD